MIFPCETKVEARWKEPQVMLVFDALRVGFKYELSEEASISLVSLRAKGEIKKNGGRASA